MKHLLFTIPLIFILSSCGNDIEEITDPQTGTVLTRYEYYSDENGQKIKDGEYSKWNNDGTLRLQENYIKGERNGISTFYQSTDSIYINIFEADKKNGVCKLENSTGTVYATFSYKNDLLNGLTKYNFIDGTNYLTATYKDNMPTGKWLYYNEGGEKAGELNFNNSIPRELIGKWTVEDLRLTSVEFKKDGKVSFWEPYNKFANTPYESMIGNYRVGKVLRLAFGYAGAAKELVFKIKLISKTKLILGVDSAEPDWILTRE